MLKGISGNQHTSHFVLNDDAPGSRVHLLQSIINRLPTSVQRQFIIDKYTDEDGATEYERTLPCIRRSASGESTDSSTITTRHNHVHSSLFDTMGWCFCCVVSGPTVLSTTTLSCCGLLSDCEHRDSTVLPPPPAHSLQHLLVRRTPMK